MAYKVRQVEDRNQILMYRKEFKAAIKDFCERSAQGYEPESLEWEILKYPIFFVIDETTTNLVGFFTLAFTLNPKGKPIIATIVHGWADAKFPHAVKYALSYIDENAEKMGLLKVNIATKRNDAAFERYFSKFGYERADVIFEKDFTKEKELCEPERELKLVGAENGI